MTKKLFILLAAVSLMWGCCPCRNLTTETDRQDSTRVEVRTQTILVPDTVFLEIPAQTAERTTRDSVSHLENEISLKSAQISGQSKVPDYVKYVNIRTEIYKYPDRKWDAQESCRNFQLSYGHFRAEYKKIFGISFHRDLIQSRISMAKYLLMTSSLSISTIALKCGYEDDKYFLRQFRTITGSTPNSYRRLK